MIEPDSSSVWEEIYSKGQRNRYPWDVIVTFVFRNAPQDVPRDKISILEVGCGTGSNLWFAAREGFSVSGVDGSRSAISSAKELFAKERLAGDLRVGNFTRLDFPDNHFDLVIDRGSLVCVGLKASANAVVEIKRVLKPGGRFFFNPYSSKHTSALAGLDGGDGLRRNIDKGTLTGVGSLCFYSREQLDNAIGQDWGVKSLQHVESVDLTYEQQSIHAEWRVVLEKHR